MGLEFSLRKLAGGPDASVTTVVETSIMAWLGYAVGRALGWTVLESVSTGAMVAVASTTIVAKAFDLLKVSGPLRDLVFGVLLVEDLFAMVFLAALTAVAAGAGVSPGQAGAALLRLACFLAALLAWKCCSCRGPYGTCGGFRAREAARGEPGHLLRGGVPGRAGRVLGGHGGVPRGDLGGEAGGCARRRGVRPVRDFFAAIFFVSVGMLIDPDLILRHAGAVAALSALVVVGKAAAVAIGAFLTGNGVRASVRAGMSLAQIGEFSFILAALGTSLGQAGSFLYPVAVAVSAVTTLSTPYAIRASGRAAAFIDRRLPPSVQTAVSFYGSWVERLRAMPDRRTLGARVRRIVRALALDAVVVSGLAIAGRPWPWSRPRDGSSPPSPSRRDLPEPRCFSWRPSWRCPSRWDSSPTGAGSGSPSPRRRSRRERSGRPTYLAAAPRRALLAILELFTALLLLLPIAAVTQPFLPGPPSAALLAVIVFSLGVAFWRSAANLQGHVRAGAEVIVEALARQGAKVGGPPSDLVSGVRAMFPGCGEPIAVQVQKASPARSHALGARGPRLDRGDRARHRAAGRLFDHPQRRRAAARGDVLALGGTQEAVLAASRLLGAEPPGGVA